MSHMHSNNGHEKIARKESIVRKCRDLLRTPQPTNFTPRAQPVPYLWQLGRGCNKEIVKFDFARIQLRHPVTAYDIAHSHLPLIELALVEKHPDSKLARPCSGFAPPQDLSNLFLDRFAGSGAIQHALKEAAFREYLQAVEAPVLRPRPIRYYSGSKLNQPRLGNANEDRSAAEPNSTNDGSTATLKKRALKSQSERLTTQARQTTSLRDLLRRHNVEQ